MHRALVHVSMVHVSGFWSNLHTRRGNAFTVVPEYMGSNLYSVSILRGCLIVKYSASF